MLVRSLSNTFGSAVVIIADRAAAGDQSGCACFSSANRPATCGLDIDVPAIAWNSSPATWPGSGNGDAAARIWMPGAVMSGLMMSRADGLGPRDENRVIDGS
jgi:hypothetical protein